MGRETHLVAPEQLGDRDILAWRCSEPNCPWLLGSETPYFKALNQLGLHNREVHGQLSSVHLMVATTARPKRQKRS